SAPSCVKALSATPFMIYQDRDEQENGGSGQDRSKPPQSRALMEVPVSKANDTPVSAESITDESTLWAARNVSVGPCPNHTRDFSLSAHLVSTPLHPHAPHSWDMEELQEENAGVIGISGAEENPYIRQPTKLRYQHNIITQKQRRLWEEEEEVRKMKQLLDDLEMNVTLQPAEQRNPAMASLTGAAFHRVEAPESVWSSRPQTGLQLQTEHSAGHAGKWNSSVAETSHPLTAPLPSAACGSRPES
ncbi:uncharacterized protein, partial [Sinocyclocheilus grahami]|uniref:uncharacterized protein n=1 Tax=Sinocyclocheilus grahami TaxID=75366 RepID=UPI0007AD52AF